MTVHDNVGVAGRLAGFSRERVAERVRELLGLVGLPSETYSERWPDELSGGQRQRVAVARALAVDPPILLMDEPFGALDPVVRRELRHEFRRIQARVNKTVLMVTHDMEEAFELGQRIGVIDAGRLIAWDTPGAVSASRDARVRELLASTMQQVTSRSES
jgi:osmoprotectant transport system ATP-binding protein